MPHIQELTADQATLEAQIARYERRGYKVVMTPAPMSLPYPLGRYRIDFKASRRGRYIAGLIRTRQDLSDLAGLVGAVASLPGWELDFISQG